MEQEGKKHLHLKLRDLISKAGIRLIELHFQRAEGIELNYVRMGEANLYYDAALTDEETIVGIFKGLGFEVISDSEDVIVERIRIAAIELIYYANNVNSLIRNSDYISERLGMPYDKLSRIFSKKCNKTLENYLIQLKIEKVKELLSNDTYTLSEISYMLGYSSVHYLSNQFKKITGITVSQYKDQPDSGRIALEDI
jgi:AraC family transcriptional regulator